MDAINAFQVSVVVCAVLVFCVLGLVIWRLNAEAPKGDE